MRFCLAILLVVAGCAVNPRVNQPLFVEPDLRATAARYLDDALGKFGRGISEVVADENNLRWHETRTLTDKRTIMVPRELDLRQVRHVYRPEKDDFGWTLRLEASGGPLNFRLKDDLNASKAEVAFRRLMRTN